MSLSTFTKTPTLPQRAFDLRNGPHDGMEAR